MTRRGTGSAARLAACAVLAAAGLLLPSVPLAAQTVPGPPAQQYDIPAQPLAAALASYARASGIDILYEKSLGEGRVSAPVRGALTPQAALSMLLAGTGLSARFTQPRAAIVYATGAPPPSQQQAAVAAHRIASIQLDMAEVRAPMLIGVSNRDDWQRYAQIAQNDIWRILRDDPGLRGQVFRVRIAVKVSMLGRIDRVVLTGGSGDAARDAHVRAILIGRTIERPPAASDDALHFEIATGRPGGAG